MQAVVGIEKSSLNRSHASETRYHRTTSSDSTYKRMLVWLKQHSLLSLLTSDFRDGTMPCNYNQRAAANVEILQTRSWILAWSTGVAQQRRPMDLNLAWVWMDDSKREYSACLPYAPMLTYMCYSKHQRPLPMLIVSRSFAIEILPHALSCYSCDEYFRSLGPSRPTTMLTFS
jgi:hypothetical protein